MIRRYKDTFIATTRIETAGTFEISRVPIAPGEDAIGSATFRIGVKGATANRSVLDEPRVRFVKTGSTLVVGSPTRPEAPHVGSGLTGASLAFVADGTDLVVRLTLANPVVIKVAVSCDVDGFYGDDE